MVEKLQQLQLWVRDSIYKKIEIAEPKLASWNAKSDPGQIAVQRYLDGIKQELDPLPQASGLFLHMEIDVKEREHLLHHHDLDNYLYPVVNRLGVHRFRFVSAIKRIGGGSYLHIGLTKPSNFFPENDSWISFLHDTGGTSAQKSEWKSGIRDALKTRQPQPLKPGAVELQLIWKCSPQRNWSSLWKPTIDGMGPVFGEPNPHRPFHLNDDRIVSLALHLNPDDLFGWSVQIGMMWRSSSTSPR